MGLEPTVSRFKNMPFHWLPGKFPFSGSENFDFQEGGEGGEGWGEGGGGNGMGIFSHVNFPQRFLPPSPFSSPPHTWCADHAGCVPHGAKNYGLHSQSYKVPPKNFMAPLIVFGGPTCVVF